MSERLTNDYAALVAMLDQAAADLQAEIDAAIDRHGLLVRTADQLRVEADDARHDRAKLNAAALAAELEATRRDATTAQDERDTLRAREVAWQLRTMAAEAEVARLRPLYDYVNECRVEAPDVLHYVDDTHYDYRTDRVYNLLAQLKSLTAEVAR